MSAVLANYQMRAFDFASNVDRLLTVKEVVDALSEVLSLFGFDHFVVTGLPNYRESFGKSVLARRWPAGWFELYDREDFIRVDPVIRYCWETVQLFEWSEAHYDPDLDPRAREVMTRAYDFGLRFGYSLPIHGLNGFGACFSMSSPKLDFNKETKPAIQLIATYAFYQLQQILRSSEERRINPLTLREREVLKWSAVGKSASEIGYVLNITERTVTAHMSNIIGKLNVSNKTQAVVCALQGRFIQI